MARAFLHKLGSQKQQAEKQREVQPLLPLLDSAKSHPKVPETPPRLKICSIIDKISLIKDCWRRSLTTEEKNVEHFKNKILALVMKTTTTSSTAAATITSTLPAPYKRKQINLDGVYMEEKEKKQAN
ncbi:unnamed protein product [Dovyalis caffra]|uniref:Uncharacterized protein n=1 Tax=Dovyalis caffra TaxID=77055 RepID=A0AAV1ST65_9ROSI|nr:unnamed protein product [Dovyalis caffra]